MMAVIYGSFAVSIEASRRQPVSQEQMQPNPLQETGQAAAVATTEWFPCLCYLSRITAELYQKNLIRHLSSCQRCRAKDLPQRLGDKRGPKRPVRKHRTLF